MIIIINIIDMLYYRLNASFGTTSYKQPSCGFEEYTVGPKLDIQVLLNLYSIVY